MHFDFSSGAGGRAWLHVTAVSSGGEVRDLRMAGKVISRSFLREVLRSAGRTKQKGAFCSKKEKDIMLLPKYHFLSPDGMSTSCKYRGAVFHSSSWLGIFNYCWGTVNFFKQTNHSKQITFEQGVMFCVIQRMKYYVYLYVHVWEGESLSLCVCVGGVDIAM